MGMCLSKLGIGGGGEVPNVVTEELLKTIGEALVDALIEFPDTFNWERTRIVRDMWWEGDNGLVEEPYLKTKIFYKDWPGNDNIVIQAALEIAAGDALKSVLGEVVHFVVDPDIDAQLNQHPWVVRSPARKAADKAIEKAVDEAVDKAVDELKKQIEGSPDKILGKQEAPKEEERSGGKQKTANPCLDKIKNKKKK